MPTEIGAQTTPRRFMTLADLTHAHHPTSGGIRTYIRAKRDFLLDHTDHRHLLVAPGPEDSCETGDRWEIRRIKGPTIPGAAPYRFFASSARPADALLAGGADAVELGTYYMPAEHQATFRARKAANRQGRALVVSAHIHTDFPRSYAEAYSSKVLGSWLGTRVGDLAERYARRALNRCDFVIVLSDQFHDQMREMGVERIVRASQGVDLDRFGPHRADASLRESFGVPPDGMLLLYSGRFDSEKHVDTLVAAFDRLPAEPAPTLVMMGEGPKRPELEAAAAERPGLHVLPYQSDPARVAALYATADVYVTAGPHEVYAFSVVEAQASGTAVVGVRAGGLVSRVPEGLGYLVEVDDADAFASRIGDAFAAREAMGAASRAHAEAQYSWAATFRPILEATEAARDRQLAALRR